MRRSGELRFEEHLQKKVSGVAIFSFSENLSFSHILTAINASSGPKQLKFVLKLRQDTFEGPKR